MKIFNCLLIGLICFGTLLQAQSNVNTWSPEKQIPTAVSYRLLTKWFEGGFSENNRGRLVDTLKSFNKPRVIDNTGKMYITNSSIKGKSLKETGSVFMNVLGQQNWVAIGDVQGKTNAITADSLNNIYIAGTFTQLNTTKINTKNTIVAKWNGKKWTQIGSDIVGTVTRISIHGNNQIYLCGKFTVQNANKAKNLVTWNGSTWVGFGNGLNGLVTDITTSRDELLFAIGAFQSSGNGQTTAEKAVKYVAVWDGESWQALPGGTTFNFVDNPVIDFYNNTLYLLGKMDKINGKSYGEGDQNHLRYAKYIFPKSSDLGGFNARVLSITDNDLNGNIYVGGDFSKVSNDFLNNITMWDGKKWNALGAGLEGEVYAMIKDKYGNLYAGGSFTTSGSTTVNHIAKWDGTKWSALGIGLDSTCLSLVTDGKYLYAGGMFDKAGNVSAKNIAKWDLSQQKWSSLGDGVNGVCYTLAFDNQYYLYAGGSFSKAGTTNVNSIARWSTADSKWETVGAGLSSGNGCYALTFDKYYNLYAAGNFLKAGSASVNHIAKWNDRTSTWSTISGKTDSITASVINVLTTDDEGNIYFAGNLNSVGYQSTSYGGYWNKDLKTWNVIDSTLNGAIDTMFTDGYYFYYGGNFVEAFGTGAYYFVRRFIE